MQKATPKARQAHPIVEKIKTGIRGFDHISEGGIPKGRTTLVTGSSGSCKTILGIEFLKNGIEQLEEPGVFVTFEEAPRDINRNIKSFGCGLDTYESEQKFAFVDVSPDPDEQIEVVGQFDLSALMVRIEHAVAKVRAKRVVIDSVGALFSRFNDTNLVRRELFRITSGLKRMNVTTMITSKRTDEYGEASRFQVEEYVADNVIILRHVLDEEKRRRTIEILKFRGAVHQNGEFPFTISDKGLEVLPLSPITLEMPSPQKRISSGNKDLDDMCGGGFFRDSILLANGATGTGKTLLSTTFINQGCKKKEKGLVFAFEESRSQMGRHAEGWGIDLRPAEEEGLLKIVSTYPESSSLPDHLLRIEREVDMFKPARISIDSLSALERVSAGKAFREFVTGLTSFIKDRQIAGLFTTTATDPPGGPSISEHHISDITDAVILLRYVELTGELRRGITVLKMRDALPEKTFREYTIDNAGLHIGEAFQNVNGILAGAPHQYPASERNIIDTLFE